MQKVQNVFPVYKLETNQKIMDLADTRKQIYCRVAIKPTGGKELSEEQKRLLSLLSEKQAKTTQRGELNGEISNVFPISIFSEYIDGLDEMCTNEEYFAEEAQQEIISQLASLLAGKEKYIFTYFVESVKTLLNGTEYEGTDILYYENEDGDITRVRNRNNLYFGFFDEDESAISFMQGRLLDDIESGNLMLDNPNDTNDKSDKPKNDNKSDKPKIKLSMKK